MSHEIRTPMNGIMGMTELMLDTDLTDEPRDNLDMIRISAEFLLTIINQPFPQRQKLTLGGYF